MTNRVHNFCAGPCTLPLEVLEEAHQARAGLAARVWDAILAVILKVGQQSLAVFVVSMFTARVMGFGLDVLGRDVATALLINLAGAVVLVATAYTAGWFKSQPWRGKRSP